MNLGEKKRDEGNLSIHVAVIWGEKEGKVGLRLRRFFRSRRIVRQKEREEDIQETFSSCKRGGSGVSRQCMGLAGFHPACEGKRGKA